MPIVYNAINEPLGMIHERGLNIVQSKEREIRKINLVLAIANNMPDTYRKELERERETLKTDIRLFNLM